MINNELLFVSFYTVNTPYEKEIQNLETSLLTFKLPYRFFPVESRGSWGLNTQYKAEIIREALLDISDSDKPDTCVVYLDADSVVKKIPILFYKTDSDFSAHWRQDSRFPSGKELLSGTMFLRPVPSTLGLVDKWIEINDSRPGEMDQRTLQSVLEDSQFVKSLGLKTTELPPEYCKIFDIMAKIKDPYIEHYQASRRYKRQINSRPIN